MVHRRATRIQSFAHVVDQLDVVQPGMGQAQPIRNLALELEFTDGSGVRWTRRGSLASEKRVRKLIADPSVRVLHDYLGEAKEVPADEREAFWKSARDSTRQSPYSSFTCSEFKSEESRHLVVVHEDC